MNKRITHAINRILKKFGYAVIRDYRIPSEYDSEIYQPYLKNIASPVIFDIGANIGQSALAFAKSFPNFSIYSFEPFSRPFNVLQQSIQRLGVRVRAVNAACGAENGWLQLEKDQFDCSQLNKTVGAKLVHSDDTDKKLVKQITVDAFCLENNIENVSILKIDTEGNDLNVLKGASRLLKEKKVQCVLSEFDFSMGKGRHTDFDKLYELMSEYNYHLADIVELSRRPNRHFALANALFTAEPTA
jgi:FkbM family methyltransferase